VDVENAQRRVRLVFFNCSHFFCPCDARIRQSASLESFDANSCYLRIRHSNDLFVARSLPSLQEGNLLMLEQVVLVMSTHE
jgi:hypothetical protein